MDDSEIESRQQTIDDFVERLVRLRADAGDPSFRQMAKRSGAISHATMHDAVQGVRLPSWETVVEFAAACGADPEDLRPEWERADAALRPAEPEPDETAEAEDDDMDAASGGGEPAAEGSASATGGRGRDRSTLIAVGLAVLAVLVAGGFGIRQLVGGGTAEAGDQVAASSGTPAATRGSDSTNQVNYPPDPTGLVSTTTGPKGCPENVLHNGPQGSARTGGDKGGFDDSGFADCSVQKRGAQLTKKFKLTNEGSVDWVGRKLVHIETGSTVSGCQMPREVMIPTIKAGQSGVVEIPVVAPDKKAVCFARWMQLDEDNQWAFPDQRPYFLSFRTK